MFKQVTYRPFSAVVPTVSLYIQKSFMGVLKQLAEYLYLRKPDPNEPRTQWMKYMHGINRISLLLFVVAMIILIIKLTLKR